VGFFKNARVFGWVQLN